MRKYLFALVLLALSSAAAWAQNNNANAQIFCNNCNPNYQQLQSFSASKVDQQNGISINQLISAPFLSGLGSGPGQGTVCADFNPTTIQYTLYYSLVGCTGGTPPAPGTPQGRLSLQSGVAVPTADTVGATTIYYIAYVGNGVPYYNGSLDNIDTITSNQVSLTLSSSGPGEEASANVFDIWWWHNSGSPVLCVATNGSGGGWASDTGGSNQVRGTGYSQINTTARSYMTNTNSITNCYNGGTNYGPIAANQGTYLGTFYTVAAGETTVNINPGGAAGGSANIVGLWNAYNRVSLTSLEADTTTSWTYASATWESLDDNVNNRISWVDGMQMSALSFIANFTVSTATAGDQCASAININSTSATPTTRGAVAVTSAVTAPTSTTVTPKLGFNYAQAMQASLSAVTCTYLGGAAPTQNQMSLTGQF